MSEVGWWVRGHHIPFQFTFKLSRWENTNWMVNIHVLSSRLLKILVLFHHKCSSFVIGTLCIKPVKIQSRSTACSVLKGRSFHLSIIFSLRNCFFLVSGTQWPAFSINDCLGGACEGNTYAQVSMHWSLYDENLTSSMKQVILFPSWQK